jgi:hypothetical protein
MSLSFFLSNVTALSNMETADHKYLEHINSLIRIVWYSIFETD